MSTNALSQMSTFALKMIVISLVQLTWDLSPQSLTLLVGAQHCTESVERRAISLVIHHESWIASPATTIIVALF